MHHLDLKSTEMTAPLLRETKADHVVDMSLEHKSIRPGIDIPDVATHLLIFLDLDSVAAYGFTTKNVLSALKKKIKTIPEMKPEDKIAFFQNLHLLMKINSSKILINQVETESKKTWKQTLGRHTAWLTPIGGALTYPVIRMSQAVTSYISTSSVADAVRNNFIVKCGEDFFKYTSCVSYGSVAFSCNDYTSETCASISDAWKGCQRMSNQFCVTCLSFCGDLLKAVTQRNDDKGEIPKFVAITAGVILVSGVIVYCRKDGIKKWFNPEYKTLSQFSAEAQSLVKESDMQIVNYKVEGILPYLLWHRAPKQEAAETLHKTLEASFLLFQGNLLRHRQNHTQKTSKTPSKSMG
jgi:hypothetical protein